MLDVVLVGLGGAVGANCRYIVGNMAVRRWGAAFPYGTVFINVSGSFILSLFVTLASRNILAEPFYRWLVAVGFCGGYTTFSTYTYETLALFRNRQPGRAWLNLVGSMVLGMAAAVAGLLIGNL